jgi:hypothetical protein
MISWRATVLAGAVVGLACGGPTDMCGCPPVAPSAAVFGRVQTAAGVPVANALVLAYVARDGNCGPREYPDASSVSRSDGNYSLTIFGPEPSEGSCVLVRVGAPLESDLLDAADTTVTLAIRYEPPFDSARVDATLSAP